MATAAHQLAELLQRRERLAARADEIAAEERAAHAAVEQASVDLVALERTAATGTKVSGARRTEDGARAPPGQDALRTAMAKACTAAGVLFSPHDLRHRRISLLHLRGVPWARIGEIVGQRNLE